MLRKNYAAVLFRTRVPLHRLASGTVYPVLDAIVVGMMRCLARRARSCRHRVVALRRARTGSNIQLKNTGHQPNGFGMVSILSERELKGCRLSDEEAAAKAVLVLDDPIAAAVLANKKDRVLRTDWFLSLQTLGFHLADNGAHIGCSQAKR